MESSSQLIRDLVRRTVQELGLVAIQPLGETLLTLAGYYVGREFRFDGVSAVWIASQGQIRFYGDAGQSLRMADVDQRAGSKAA